VPECAGRGRPRANTHRSYSVRTRLTDRLEGVLKIIRLVEKTGGLRGADVSTLPAIEEAAAQITDEGATGPLGFVHPHTAYPSASSVTILSEQRREPAQARGRQLSEKDSGLVAESWMGWLCRRTEHKCSFAVWTERPPGSSRDMIPYRVANSLDRDSRS